MKKILLTLTVALTLCSNSFATSRVLQCTNDFGQVTFNICGINGCSTKVTDDTTTTTYNMKRVRNANQSLTYTTNPRSRKLCTIIISPLRNGIRSIASITCSKDLKNAVCAFSDSTQTTVTPTPTDTPES